MADDGLEIFPQRENEYRINHTDFGDVQITTFAKGVIVDFEIVTTDPFAVRPMVKVVIGDDEIEGYIPLFYKPKADYWDGIDVGAQEYDEETNSYKQAWQSFRCGDEVVVLLKEDEPKLVLGFYDNYPRIGEDVVKWVQYSGDPPEYGRVSQRTNTETWGHYDFENDIGPDGSPLHLTVEAESVWSSVYYWVDNYLPRYDIPRNGYGADILQNIYYKTPKHPRYWCPHYLIDDPNGNCIWGGGQCQIQEPNDRIIVIRYGEVTSHKIGSQCSSFLVPVGPILYVVYSLWEPYYLFKGSTGRSTYKSGKVMCDELKDWLETFQDGYEDWDKPSTAFTLDEPPIFELLEDNTVSIEDEYEDQIIFNQIKAGLYTKDLYDIVLSDTMNARTTWFSWQDSNWNRNIDHFNYVSDDLYWQWFGENNLRYGGPLEDFIWHMKDKLMIRPHTKQEIIEAGLWPPDDNVEQEQ